MGVICDVGSHGPSCCILRFFFSFMFLSGSAPCTQIYVSAFSILCLFVFVYALQFLLYIS